MLNVRLSVALISSNFCHKYGFSFKNLKYLAIYLPPVIPMEAVASIKVRGEGQTLR